MNKNRYTAIISAILNDAKIIADPLAVLGRVEKDLGVFSVDNTRVGLFIEKCKSHGVIIHSEEEKKEV